RTGRLAAYRARVPRDARYRLAAVGGAARARGRAAAVRPAGERDAAGSHAARRAAGLEWWQRLGLRAGRPAGCSTDGCAGVGRILRMRNSEWGMRSVDGS